MKNAHWFVAFVLLTFSLIAVNFAIVSSYLPILQESYPSWRQQSANFILSDILFVEGALALVAGAVFAGFSLYTMVGPDRQWSTQNRFSTGKLSRKSTTFPQHFKIGLVLLGVGILCITAAIIVTL